jgi:hypothetical protein
MQVIACECGELGRVHMHHCAHCGRGIERADSVVVLSADPYVVVHDRCGANFRRSHPRVETYRRPTR